jgi:hypothetical protein
MDKQAQEMFLNFILQRIQEGKEEGKIIICAYRKGVPIFYFELTMHTFFTRKIRTLLRVSRCTLFPQEALLYS